MSLNSPRPPRPPRPGGGMPGARPSGPPQSSGIQQSAAPAKSDFGDTRTVILSRKDMGMQQKKKGEPGAPQGSAPVGQPVQQQLPKASVVNNTVTCVKCPGNFPILGDEYYGAVVECPDCAAEFVIPSKAEVMASAPVAPQRPAAPQKPAAPQVAEAPVPPTAAAPVTPAAPAPVAAPPKAPQAAPAGGTKAKTQAPIEKPEKAAAAPAKKRAVKKVPPFMEAELDDDEEVVACETQETGSGSAVLVAVFALLAGLAGMLPALLGLDKTVAIAVSAGAGVVFAAISFVVAKGNCGSKGLVVTNRRAIVKVGKWSKSTDLN